MDNNITERIAIHKVGLFFLENFSWIEREQPISDYGIDMLLKIKDDNKATGVLIALQIKSGKSYFKRKKDNNIIFDKGNPRHLEYWENHSLPVIVILYNPDEDKLYWQSIASRNANIKINEKSWNMQIPLEQKLTLDSKENILEECFNLDGYEIVEETDSSVNRAKRYTLKVIISAKEKYIIKKIIKNIHDKLTVMYDNINVLNIFYYKSIYEVQDGLYFCRTQWNDKNYKYSLNTIRIDETINSIDIEWNRDFEIFNKFHINNDNFISKFKYIKICDEVVEYFNILFEELKDKNFQESKEYILDFEVEILNKWNDRHNKSYQLSAEMFQLKVYKNEIIDTFYDLLIVFQDKKRTESNLKNCLIMYLKDIEKDIELYNREKKFVS